jgi:hypothetical protein
MTTTSLRHIDNDQESIACYAVTRELRPNLDSQEAFIAQFRRQSTQAYCLLAM